jgi:hypothetical protein
MGLICGVNGKDLGEGIKRGEGVNGRRRGYGSLGMSEVV